jgi:hypothetical protein
MGTASLVSIAMVDIQTRIGLPCKTNNIKISTDSIKTISVTMVQAEEASTVGVDGVEAVD